MTSPSAPPFSEIDLTPHLPAHTMFESLRLAASDDAIWACVHGGLLAVDAGGAARRVLDAPPTAVLVHLAAVGSTVAVATSHAGLLVSHDGQRFTRVAAPTRRGSRESLLACRDGSLWLQLGVGAPTAWQWWCRPRGGAWTEIRNPSRDALLARYGLSIPLPRLETPCMTHEGTVMGLEDERTKRSDAEGLVRLQSVHELSCETDERWTKPVDLEHAGVPITRSGCIEAEWLDEVCLGLVGAPATRVWFLGRADGLYRIAEGRAARVAPATRALYTDGSASVLAVGYERPTPTLRVSRDAGLTFEVLPSIAPRELTNAVFWRGSLFLGLVGRSRPRDPPMQAWIVRAGL